MDEYELYEKECEKIKEENEQYLSVFYEYLIERGLTEKTIAKHLNNVSFYLNYYLLDYEPIHMKEGCFHLDDFLGNWFIRKAMWSSVTNIKATAASLKKFYACMLEKNMISQEDYQNVVITIKDNMDDWIGNMRAYNNISIDW